MNVDLPSLVKIGLIVPSEHPPPSPPCVSDMVGRGNEKEKKSCIKRNVNYQINMV